MTERIVVGLGGNVGDDAAIVARFAAVADALAAWGPVHASPVFRTAPIGPAQQDFLNAALSLRADPVPTPRELAAALQELERLLGRARLRHDTPLAAERRGQEAHDRRVVVDDEHAQPIHRRSCRFGKEHARPPYFAAS